jgi:hypothetical protein
MSISTYFRPNIHQNGPEILGVNGMSYFEILERHISTSYLEDITFEKN